MVKISIKKDKKAIKGKPKPRQKQKQKQSQKVIVNIGSSTAPKRRTPAQALQKGNVVNKPTPTPNIYVPQSNPIFKQPESQNSITDLIKYFKESDAQKEKSKPEKNNELEKDKAKAKTKSIIQDEEEAQTNFSIVDSQNISALTSGTATPNPLSFPVDHNSLYDSLMRVADLRGENPNSSRVSFSTLQSNPLSSNLTSTNTSIDSYPTQFIRSDGVDTRFESTRETAQLAPSKTTQAIAGLWLNTARQAIADRESSGSSILSSNSTTPSIDDILSNTQAPPMPVEEVAIESEPEPEPVIIEPPQQELIVVNPPQTEAPLLYETDTERDKVPAVSLDAGTKSLSSTEDQTTPPLKKEEPRQAEEPTPIAKLPDIIPFEDVINQFGLKQLGQILIKNKINSEDGYPFFIKDGHVKTTLFNSNTARLKQYQMDKDELKRYLIDAHKKGLINI